MAKCSLPHFTTPTPHINSNAKSDYELLKEVGIFFDSANQLADMINKNWDNIEAWWQSEQVQAARTNFCKKYSKLEEMPIKKLTFLLKTNLDITNRS